MLKLVNELNKILILPMPIIRKAQTKIEIENIQSVPIGEEGGKKKENKKRKRKSIKDEKVKTMVQDSIMSEKFLQTRVHEMVAGADSSRPTMDIKRGSDTTRYLDIQLSAPAITGATIVDVVLLVDGTNVEKNKT